MAVAGTISLGEILEELKRLREDFGKWIKMEKKRREAADKRFACIETTLGAIAEAQFSRYVWEELREEIKGRREAVLRRERNVELDGVDIVLLVETDKHVYVVEVKTRPKIADVGLSSRNATWHNRSWASQRSPHSPAS